MEIKKMGRVDYRSAKNIVDNGGRFVRFSYCYSFIFFTNQEETAIYATESYAQALLHGAKYTLLTVLLGWWGIPFGPIYSIQSLIINLKGGEDVTGYVLNELESGDVSFLARRGLS